MATQPETVEALLGLPVSSQETRLALAYSIERGLPVTALDRLAEKLAPDDDRFKFGLISKATLARRRKSASRRLTLEEGNRLARLATVFASGLDTFKTPEKAREFLSRPPSDVGQQAAAEGGARYGAWRGPCHRSAGTSGLWRRRLKRSGSDRAFAAVCICDPDRALPTTTAKARDFQPRR